MPKARNIKSLNKGALALAHAGHSTEQIARACAVSEAAVNYWIAGQKKPALPMRRKLRKLYGIDIPWWDEPAGDGADVLAKIRGLVMPPGKHTIELGEHGTVDLKLHTDLAIDEARVVIRERPSDQPGVRTESVTWVQGDAVATEPKEVRDVAGEHIDRCRRLMQAIESDKLMTFSEKARLCREVSIAIDKAGRLTGASAEIPESRILRTPAWQRIGKRIADAILSYEDKKVSAAIMRKVAEALKEAE